MKPRNLRLISVTLIFLLTAGTAFTFQTELDSYSSEMRALIEGFSADRGSLMRTYNIEA